MAAKIEYTRFVFRIPPPPNEEEFNVLKKELNENPNFKLTNPEEIPGEVKFFLILLTLIVLSLTAAEYIRALKWLEVISLLLAFASLGFLLSFLSFVKYIFEKKSFYASLKKNIKKSKDFKEFRERRKGYYRRVNY